MSPSSEGSPRFFIAGATGYTGQHLVREAAQHGMHTVAHIRPDSSQRERCTKEFESHGALIDTSPWEEEALVEAFQVHQPTHIFALLGTTKKRGRHAKSQGLETEDYETIDYGLSAMLLRATQRAAPEARFIYLSSRGVSPTSRLPYLAVRARLEAELRDSGLHYLIARPGFITGSDRGEFRMGERTAAVLSDGILGMARILGARRLHANHASLSGETLAKGLAAAGLDTGLMNQEVDTALLRELAGRWRPPTQG